MTPKKILITGVHKGLGLGLAQTYLQNGWLVWGISRAVPNEIESNPGFTFCHRDLLQLDGIAEFAIDLANQAGGFDLVILNAGMLGAIQRFEKTAYAEIRSIMDVNVWANKALLDGLLAPLPSPKQIVAISSGAAKNGSAGWGPYSVSKAALDMLIKVVANENPDTHFCALAPGLVGTDMLGGILNAPPRPEFEADGRLRQSLAAGRIMSPDDAAALIYRIAPKLTAVQSGSHQDVRELPFEV